MGQLTLLLTRGALILLLGGKGHWIHIHKSWSPTGKARLSPILLLFPSKTVFGKWISSSCKCAGLKRQPYVILIHPFYEVKRMSIQPDMPLEK